MITMYPWGKNYDCRQYTDKTSYWTKTGVRLPITTKAKLIMLVKKQEVLFRCCVIWEDGRLLSQSPSPQHDQDKSQCPEFLLQFKVQSFEARRWLHPSKVTCSWLLLLISGSLRAAVCGGCAALGYAAARASRSCECTRWATGAFFICLGLY